MQFFDKPTKISGYIPFYTLNGVRMGAKEYSHWLPLFLHIFCNSLVFKDRTIKISGYIPLYTFNGVRMGAKENSHWLPLFLHIFCNSLVFKARTTKFSDIIMVNTRNELPKENIVIFQSISWFMSIMLHLTITFAQNRAWQISLYTFAISTLLFASTFHEFSADLTSFWQYSPIDFPRSRSFIFNPSILRWIWECRIWI